MRKIDGLGDSEERKLDILNGGYVILHDVMGDDLTVVNSARVSYNKKQSKLEEKDKRLIKFLAREGHTSPFRHANLQFEVYVPLIIARQHWKHIIGSGFQDPFTAWNESSRRYITEECEFYIPESNQWRGRPENSKQGSEGILDETKGMALTNRLIRHTIRSERLYNEAMEDGVAAEQARLFLPAYALFIRYYWSASLQGVAHFLNLRLEDDAQHEIRELADAVEKLSIKKFPLALGALLGKEDS